MPENVGRIQKKNTEISLFYFCGTILLLPYEHMFFRKTPAPFFYGYPAAVLKNKKGVAKHYFLVYLRYLY